MNAPTQAAAPAASKVKTTNIFVFTMADPSQPPLLIEAPGLAAAYRAVAEKYFKGKLASAKEVADAMQRGATIEKPADSQQQAAGAQQGGQA